MRNLHFGTETTTQNKMKTVSVREQLSPVLGKIHIRKQGVRPWEWYAAFFLFTGGISWNMFCHVAYLHEFGHVFFAYLTLGSGKIVHSHLAQTLGGWWFLIGIGGSLFVILFGHLLFALALKLRRPWCGAFWLGCAYPEIFRLPGSVDSRIAGINAWQWYGLVAVVLFFLWVFIAYVAVRNLKTIREEDYNKRGAYKTGTGRTFVGTTEATDNKED